MAVDLAGVALDADFFFSGASDQSVSFRLAGILLLVALTVVSGSSSTSTSRIVAVFRAGEEKSSTASSSSFISSYFTRISLIRYQNIASRVV